MDLQIHSQPPKSPISSPLKMPNIKHSIKFLPLLWWHSHILFIDPIFTSILANPKFSLLNARKWPIHSVMLDVWPSTFPFLEYPPHLQHSCSKIKDEEIQRNLKTFSWLRSTPIVNLDFKKYLFSGLTKSLTVPNSSKEFTDQGLFYISEGLRKLTCVHTLSLNFAG